MVNSVIKKMNVNDLRRQEQLALAMRLVRHLKEQKRRRDIDEALQNEGSAESFKRRIEAMEKEKAENEAKRQRDRKEEAKSKT